MRAFKITPAGAEMLWKKPFNDGAGVIYEDHVYVPEGFISVPISRQVNLTGKSGVQSLSASVRRPYSPTARYSLHWAKPIN